MTNARIDLSDVVLARNIAAGAGDMFVAVQREVVRLVKESHGNIPAAIKVGIRELRQRGLVEPHDVQVLESIADALFAPDGPETRKSVETLLHQLLISPSSSPVAIAIASSASRAMTARNGSGERPTTIARIGLSPEQGGYGGAIVGAAMGGLVGGLGGAAIGAVVGWALGTTVGACDSAGT